MPYDTNGNYSLPSGYLAVTGQTIQASQHNPPLEDIGAALSQVLVRTGIAPMLGNLNMNSFKVTGLATATAPGDAPRFDQVIVAPADIDGDNLLAFDGSQNAVQDTGIPFGQVARLDQENVLAAGTAMSFASEAPSQLGPSEEYYHNSASPAANDTIHRQRHFGNDDAGTKTLYSAIITSLLDPTDTSEDARISIQTVVDGSFDERLHIGAGLYMDGATGGDQGAGTINATEIYENGLRIGGAPNAVFQDQKSAGTDGGTFTAFDWRVRDLNTKEYDPGNLITLSSNTFTPSVDGRVEWSAPSERSGLTKSRLWNVTDGVTAGVGTNMLISAANNGWGLSTGGASVEGGKTYRVEHQCNNSTNNIGFGSAANFGEPEVYTRVQFWRTA